MATHPDRDHITGLVEVLKRFHIGGWMDNGQDVSNATHALCQDHLQAAYVARHVAVPGEKLDLGDGLSLEILHPQLATARNSEASDNNESVVLRIVWNRISFLPTGDPYTQGEHSLINSQRPLDADVLKVAHHGSRSSTSPGFLSAVSPRYAVISVGANNRYGHPEPEVLERLAQSGDVRILRTDRDGTIEFITDDSSLWINTSR